MIRARWTAWALCGFLAVACAPEPAELDRATFAPATAAQPAAAQPAAATTPPGPLALRPAASWLSEVQARIVDGEYAIQADEDGLWRATNRNLGWRARWDRGGVELRPRGVDGGARVSLGLRGEPADAPKLGGCRADGALDEFGGCLRALEQRRPTLTERWENRADGLEHVIVLHEPPDHASTAPLSLELTVAGARASVDSDGLGATLAASDGQALRYEGLKVFDADGQTLWAWMEPTADGLRLRVDARGAAYPVTIDPTFRAAPWRAYGPQAGSEFGAAIASGDVDGDGYADLIVGAPGYDIADTSGAGRVYVYFMGAQGPRGAPWFTQAPIPTLNGRFGHSLAAARVDGDNNADFAVGSPGANANGGAVYMYLGSSSPTRSVESIEGDNGQRVGQSLAFMDYDGQGLPGLLVAREGADGQIYYGWGGTYFSGTLGVPAVFTQAAALPNLEGGDSHVVANSGGIEVLGNRLQSISIRESGLSVAVGDVSGDGVADLVVGRPNANSGAGAVSLYLGEWNDGSDGGLPGVTFEDSAEWTLNAPQAGTGFGATVAVGYLDANGLADIVVGAPEANGGRGRVAAYLTLDPRAAPTSATWSFEGAAAGARLGDALTILPDLDGDFDGEVLVGAPSEDALDGTLAAGAVYLIPGDSGAQGARRPWEARGQGNLDRFSEAVASAGDLNADGYDDLVVGAPGYDSNFADAGRVYVYPGAANGPSQTALANALQGPNLGAHLGTSVAPLGDFDGDGYDDFAIGVPGHTLNMENGTNSGAVVIYHGGATLAALRLTTLYPRDTGGDLRLQERFGTSVAGAGDVNGDGLGDLLVGVPDASGGAGNAYLFLGRAGANTNTPADWDASSIQRSPAVVNGFQGDRFGASVAGLGDYTGDGLPDIAIGAPYAYRDATSDSGRVYIFPGSRESGAPLGAHQTLVGGPGHAFGYSLAGGGDVNGDGRADLLVSAFFYHSNAQNQFRESAAFLYHGPETFTASTRDWSTHDWLMDTDQPQAEIQGLALAGDVNGDGYADALVGARSYDLGPTLREASTQEGRVWLFLGGPNGLTRQPSVNNTDGPTYDWTLAGGAPNANLGYAVAFAGDTNGDGLSDLLVGSAPRNSGPGAAYLYLGEVEPPSQTLQNLPGPSTQANLGASTAFLGDLNGDGFGDMAVGAPNGASTRGLVQIYLGRASGLPASPSFSLNGGNAGDRFGHAVAAAGDVNGDGYDDLLVGAPGSATFSGGSPPCRAYLFAGGPGAPTLLREWRGSDGDRLGWALAGGYDDNADGFADVWIGAPNATGGNGIVYHVFGASDLSAAPLDASFRGGLNGEGFGLALAAGDFNGDNAPELAVGLRAGPLSLLAQNTASPIARYNVPTPDGTVGFGRALASVGDVNGDAIGDLLVGASSSDGPDRAFFYAGAPLMLPTLAGGQGGWTEGAQPLYELREGAGFGHSLAGVGDVNNDGLHDLAIGLPNVNEVALHLGSLQGPSPAPSLRLSGDSNFGAALAGGDLNGDGLAELWVGAPLDTPALLTQAGSVQVFSAHPDHRATTPARLVRAGTTTSLLSNARACDQAGQLWMSTQGPISPAPARLQLQVLGAGTPWSPPLGTNTTTSDPALAPVSARLTLPTQPPGEALRWRARVLFDAPGYSRGPWRYGNAADLPRAVSWVVGRPFGVTRAPSGDVTLEEGESLSYTLTLDACPAESVSLGTTFDVEEPRLSVVLPPNFSTTQWRTPQTVTLRLADDEIDNEVAQVTLTHTIYGAGPTPYNLQFRATLGDGETSGLLVDADGVGVLSEGVTPAECVFVSLGSEPVGVVAVATNSARPELLNDALPELFFDESNWDQLQEVCPIALNDSIDRGDTYDLPLTFTASGSDPVYSGRSTERSFTVQDNDTAGIARPMQAQTLRLSEVQPRSATFTLALTSDPMDAVTLTLTDTVDLTFRPSSVSFNSSTWDEPATITVSATPDGAAEGVEVHPLVAQVSSGDRFYQALGSVPLNYTVEISDVRLENSEPTVALRLLDAQMGSVPEGSTARIELQSSDADNELLTFAWDLDGDGAFGEPGESPEAETGGTQDRQVFRLVFPDGPSEAAVRVRASDPRGGQAEALLQVGVSDVPPVFVGNLPTEARVGREYRFELVVEDPGDDDFVWSLWSPPTGMTLDDGPDACPWAGVGPSRCNALSWTPSEGQEGMSFAVVVMLLENGQEAARVEREVTVVPNRPPDPLTLLSPEDGAVVGGEVELVVGEGTDPDGDPLTYEFEVFDAQTGARVAGQAGILAGGVVVSWTVNAALVEDTLYGWRARAWDARVNGPWLDADPNNPAPTFVYSTRNGAPSEPVLLRPLRVASSARPTFEAQPSRDPELRALLHRFSLYRNEGADDEPANDVFVAQSELLATPGEGALSWRPNADMELGVPHRWCVQAFEPDDGDPDTQELEGSACVQGLVFDGENDAPSAPALLWPLVDGEVQGLEGLVLVAGASEDPEGEEVSHRVTVSLSNTLSPGPTVEVEALEGEVGLPWARVRGPLGEVPEDAWVYWRVTATDPQGAEGSSLGRFRYSATNGAPSAPRIRGPGEGEGVGRSDVGFVWGRADDPEGDAVLYEVEVRQEGQDAPVWAGEVLPSEDGGGVLGGVPLRERSAYAWRVRAVDVRGAQGEWSEASFRVLGLSEPLLPPAPSLVSPEAGASFKAPAVVGLQWGEVSDPEGRALTYFVEVARARLEGGVGTLDDVWASEFDAQTQEAQVAPQLTGGGYVWRVGVSTPETQPVWSPWRRFSVSQEQEEGEDKDPTRVPQTSLPSTGCAQVQGSPRGLWGLLVVGWVLWRGGRRRA